MSDVLERVRMCVAEAGYDPDLVGLRGEVIIFPPTLPVELAWRARELASQADDESAPACLRCSKAMYRSADRDALFDACIADRYLVLDCGRDR